LFFCLFLVRGFIHSLLKSQGNFLKVEIERTARIRRPFSVGLNQRLER
jgi:hypothetical protein